MTIRYCEILNAIVVVFTVTGLAMFFPAAIPLEVSALLPIA